MSEKKKTTSIRKLTKDEIIEYYHRIAYPEKYNVDFVPVDMKVKAFDKLLSWMEVKIPEQVKEDKKMEKMVFEIRCVEK